MLNRLSLTRFRNHKASHLDHTRQFNLLIGENGAGKTNVLEAISLLAPGRGLRRATLVAMAQDSADQPGFAISARLMTPSTPGGDHGPDDAPAESVMLATGTHPERPARRLVHVNGAQTSALALGEWLNIGWLTPSMDRLFAEGASARRRFMDRMVLAHKPAHARHASAYDKALSERNRLIGADMPPDPVWLDAIEAQMAEAGAALATSRLRWVDTLNAKLTTLPNQPFARPALALAPGGPAEEGALRDALIASRPQDRMARRSLCGPHRDDLVVTMAGRDMPASACSTGEQKAMLIAIILAQAASAAHAVAAPARPGVLLLDEIAAHLDPVRRHALFDRLREGHAQIWMTGTEITPFSAIADEAAIWHVEAGQVKQIN